LQAEVLPILEICVLPAKNRKHPKKIEAVVCCSRKKVVWVMQVNFKVWTAIWHQTDNGRMTLREGDVIYLEQVL